MQLDSPQFDPMWQLFSDQGTLVFVHPTTACHRDDLREYALSMAVDNLAQTTLAISRLVYSGVLVRFPGIRWLFAHLGGVLPFLIHRLDNYHQQFSDNRRQSSALPSEILKGVYFDTVSTHPPAIRCAFETFPVSQFVFGTDFPHVPGGMERFTQALRDSGLGPEELAQVEWKTAARLLGLDTP
jgi:aminocarboxymuconate-semialdehyde decarboxylase